MWGDMSVLCDSLQGQSHYDSGDKTTPCRMVRGRILDPEFLGIQSCRHILRYRQSEQERAWVHGGLDGDVDSLRLPRRGTACENL